MEMHRDKMAVHAQKVIRRGAIDHSLSSFKDIKDLQPSGILDFKFLQRAEKDGKIRVDFDDINKIMQNLENQKNEAENPDEFVYKYEPENIAKIKLADLKQRFSIVHPNYPINDLNTLFSGRLDVTAEDMTELLQENEVLEEYDPLKEATAFFVGQNNELDFDKIAVLMQQLGYRQFDKKDKEILKECLDVDRDGRITDKDIKEVANFVNNKCL